MTPLKREDNEFPLSRSGNLGSTAFILADSECNYCFVGLDKEVLYSINAQLNEWVLEHKRIPRSDGDPYERFLGQFVEYRGGHLQVFLHELNVHSRQLLAIERTLPRKTELESAILEMEHINEASLSILRAYIVAYEPGTLTGTESAIKQKLQSKRIWRPHLRREALDQFRLKVKRVNDECAKRVLDYKNRRIDAQTP